MAGETAQIQLNGQAYVVRLPIKHSTVLQQTAPIRTTGTFLRINNPNLDAYDFNDWSRGFGTQFIRPGHPEDRQGFYEATVQTLWKSGIVLPPNRNDITTYPTAHSGYNIRGSAKFNGATWLLFSPVDIDTGAVDTVEARSVSGLVYGGGGTVLTEAVNTDKIRGFDMIAAGGKLVAIMGLTNDHILRYSTDGITWTAPATTAPPLNYFTSAALMVADDAGARLCWGPGTVANQPRLVLAMHNQTTNSIEIWDSTNGGDTWQTRTTFVSGGGPNGIAAYLDVTDEVVYYVGTREGVWLVDLVPTTATAQMILPMPIANLNGQRLTVHNAALYVPVDHGTTAPFGMKTITVSNSTRKIDDVGLDQGQSVPSTLNGQIYWMESAGPFLLTLSSDATYLRLLALSGISSEGWQNIRYASNPSVHFVTDGNHIHIAENGATSTVVAALFRMDNVLAPPTSGATFIYDATAGGFDLQLPEFGSDAPSEPGVFLQVQDDGSAFVDAAETIVFKYGVNGASPTTTGPTLDNTNRKQNLGTSNRGISARTLRCVLNFTTSGTTKSPLLREFVLLFRKRLEDLRSYEFDIDVEATKSIVRGSADIRSELQAMYRSTTLVPFIASEDAGEVEVEVIGFSYHDWITGPPNAPQHSQIQGLAHVVLQEMLQHSQA